MATFVHINYFARGKNNDSFTVYKSVFDKPWSCYLNLDTVERISEIQEDSLNVKLKDNSMTSVESKHFFVYTNSNTFYALKEEEFSKFISPKESL